VLLDEAPAAIDGPLFISLSGLPVDQQRAVRVLVDALSYKEPQGEDEQCLIEA
jgi:hypothetical protein